jgi:hypothetical protein
MVFSDPWRNTAAMGTICEEKGFPVIFSDKDETRRAVSCVPMNFRAAPSITEHDVFGLCCNNNRRARTGR